MMLPIIEIIIFLTTILIAVIVYFYQAYQYWKKNGVPSLPIKFPLGNANTIFSKGFSVGTLSKTFYDEFKKRGEKFGGVYLVTVPNLVLVDPEIIKDVLMKDFYYFVDRGMYYNREKDPISAHLFALDGIEWKNLRVKLTPTFTSGKIKIMFETIVKCGNNMKQAIDENLNTDLNIKEMLGCFTTDVIGSCAFGIECNSFKYPDAEFRQMGKRIFDYTFWKALRGFFIMSTPKLAKQMGLSPNTREVQSFFQRIVRETVRMREEKNIRRDDFLQILIDLKDEADFTIEDIAAQVFIFFIGGFETSSTSMTFALYELAKNQKIQEELRKEIGKYDEITYDAIKQMKLLDKVILETLRMYPALPTLNRRCSKDYKLRNTNITIEKGTSILIPSMGLHMDSDYFPEPEKFDPERFSEENISKRPAFVHLPFGDGPRNCIGVRFGMMQSKIGVLTMIKNFKLTVSPNNKPVEFHPCSFLLTPLHEVLLKAEKI